MRWSFRYDFLRGRRNKIRTWTFYFLSLLSMQFFGGLKRTPRRCESISWTKRSSGENHCVPLARVMSESERDREREREKRGFTCGWWPHILQPFQSLCLATPAKDQQTSSLNLYHSCYRDSSITFNHGHTKKKRNSSQFHYPSFCKDWD